MTTKSFYIDKTIFNSENSSERCINSIATGYSDNATAAIVDTVAVKIFVDENNYRGLSSISEPCLSLSIRILSSKLAEKGKTKWISMHNYLKLL